MTADVAVVVKGYPRLSETFIARELLALEQRGIKLQIVSLRHPTDKLVHDLHRQIAANVLYLPEYLYQEPLRVLKAALRCLLLRGFWPALGIWLRDLWRDPTSNRGRRFGQAIVMAAELGPAIRHIYVHFIHTPGSAGRYAAVMRSLPLSLSAHAKDIWTTPAWEKREKLEAARWTVTCTHGNLVHLREVAPEAKVELLYHGVDTGLFRPRSVHAANQSLRLICIARAVPKKGLETLLAALATLPDTIDWHLDHVGGGELVAALRTQAQALGIAKRIVWHGATSRPEVVALLAQADIFCLVPRIAADGDRDGLPNVILEAMASGLPVVASDVAAIGEAVIDGVSGMLVPVDSAEKTAAAILRLAEDPALRAELGAAGRDLVIERFTSESGFDLLASRLGPPTASRAA